MRHDLDYRKFVIGGIAIVIVIVYTVRLFVLQIMRDDYRKSADSNAFLKKIEYPSRGVISDRNGELLVYNQPAYDIMVVMNEAKDRLDTLEFCQALGISKAYFIRRMNEIKDRSKNPGYSRFTQQLFMAQLSNNDFSVFREKLFRFPGFYIQQRSIRQYQYPYAAHVLGDVAEVSESDIENDDYYQAGDFIGKLGIERYYEKQLRGEKGVQILLRDAHGRIKGKYQNGMYDSRPVAGKDLTLSLDIKLQALGERLLEGKIGSIVAIEPAIGTVTNCAAPATFSSNYGTVEVDNVYALPGQTVHFTVAPTTPYVSDKAHITPNVTGEDPAELGQVRTYEYTLPTTDNASVQLNATFWENVVDGVEIRPATSLPAVMTIYTTGGQFVASETIASDGELKVRLNRLPAGVYIIYVNNHSFKVQKK